MNNNDNEQIHMGRKQVSIGNWGLLIAVVAIVVGLLSPEIRRFMGLESTPSKEAIEPTMPAAIILPTSIEHSQSLETPILELPNKNIAPSIAPDDAGKLAGVWVGKIKNTNNELEIRIELVSTCPVDNICGSFNLASIPCRGDLQFIRSEGSKYYFKAKNFEGDCATDTQEDSLDLLSDGALKYYSRGTSYGESTGILAKQ